MNEGVFYCLSRRTFRKSHFIVRLFALWLVLICPVFSSDAQINPIYGLPPKSQPEPLPKECSNSPQQTIGQIDTGMGIIGGCGVTRIFLESTNNAAPRPKKALAMDVARSWRRR